MGLTEYEWTNTYNQLVNCAGILGLTVGAATAACPLGRKEVTAGFCAVALTGLGMSLTANFWSIIIGRLLHGISTGVFICTGTRMMDVYDPQFLNEDSPIKKRESGIEYAADSGSSYKIKRVDSREMFNSNVNYETVTLPVNQLPADENAPN